MTIGYVLDDTLDKPDGVQQAMISIGEHVRSLGHNVHYIVADTERTDLEHVHSIGRFWSLHFNGNSVRTPKPASMKDIKAVFTNVDFDVLHVQMPFSPFLAGRVIAAAPKHTKIFGTFHILPYNTMSRLGTQLVGKAMKRSLNRFDHMFAVSEPARVFMEQAFNIEGTVLPNPVDYNFYAAKKKKPYTKINIVFIGRFDERKGVSYLLDAYACLPIEIRNKTTLTMCGKGPMLDSISKKSDALGLGIVLPGFVSEDEKAQYLANADIAVFPSISGESFGIVLTEAMSAKAGVTLGGNNPGYASVIGKWPETLFDPTNIDEFSTKLLDMITNPKLRASIGKQQHEYVKQFDINNVTDVLLKNYTK